MKRKRIKYTNEPMEGVVVIDDFLPPPDKLVFKEPPVKVTLTLSKRSVDCFKRHAAENHVGYQAMIRAVVDKYAEHFPK